MTDGRDPAYGGGVPLRSLKAAREAAAGCRACPLWAPATQTVFGEGPARARMLLVGEQPGDQEDLAGRPFVGPAGRLLDRLLAEAGIDRAEVYLTNAVKHFKHTVRGKRRIHQRPVAGEIEACHPWIDAELRLVKPRVVVLMGAVAVRSMLGPGKTLRDARQQPFDVAGAPVVVTIHPSAVLRAADDRAAMSAELLGDLRHAAALLASTDQRPTGEAPTSEGLTTDSAG
jgi:uracil-DNA glycosylase family protein